MAGAGYKLFNTGDVLTAAQVNTYLQEQTVMVFADATARTTALSGVLAEGMVTYLKDTNAIEKYTGAAWVNIDSGSTSPLTTKGDLYTYSTTDARLAVGNNGETLVADSSATTGLRWQATGAAGKNFVINGGMDIWQRGTSNTTTANAYLADRWQKEAATHYGMSRQTTSDTTNLPFIQYSLRMQRTNGSTNTNNVAVGNSFETVNSIPLAGRTVTLSFYARKGTNMSATSSTFNGQIYTGTGTDQNITGTYTGLTAIATASVTLTSTWQRFTCTGTIGTTANEVAVYFYYTPTGTAGADDWVELTGVQLELGSVATSFSRCGGTLAGELAACQRYYEKSYDVATAPGTNTSTGMVYATAGSDSGNSAGYLISFKVTKRGTPTMTFYEEGGTAGNWKYTRSGVGSTAATANAGYNGQNYVLGYVNSGAAWAVVNVQGHWVASAEL